MDSFTGSIRKMVAEQIAGRNICDPRVQGAMRTVPRHEFVPLEYQNRAYSDEPLPIGFHQTISQPYMVALMCSLAQIKPQHRILDIGTGSGYQAAILSLLASFVYSIERIPALANRARKTLDHLGYKNISVRIGDGVSGWIDEAPFDAILVAAAAKEIPSALSSQLADGGRLIIPVGTNYQQLTVVENNKGQISEEVILPVRFVPLVC